MDGPERAYFGYYGDSRTAIHNANLLIAAMVARAADPDSPEMRAAGRAVAFSLDHQNRDGSWPYGEDANLRWVDGFHTGFVLDALATWHAATGDARVLAAVRRGLELYITRLLVPSGAARATVTSTYPVDIHACATAVVTLCRLRALDSRALPAAERVLEWTLDNMRRRDGRFAFQRRRWGRNSVPYIRWNDAHMMLALASYLNAMTAR